MRKFSLLLLILISCSKPSEQDSESTSNCPKTKSPSSNLSINPTPQTAISVHANGKSTTWNWQLSGAINSGYNVNLYDIDLFDTSSATITALKSSGKKVICYFSAGSSENWRSDFSSFNSSDKGSNLDGWDGEKWLDIRSLNVLNIMKSRIDLALSKGCDGVEPDNMDGYTNDKCFSLTTSDQLKYNQAIANYARSKGLSVGLKNDPDQASQLEPYFDFSVTEQCYQYSECESYSDFSDNNKPVFNAEYENKYRVNPDRSSLCTYSSTNNIQTLILDIDLDDSFRHSCN